MADGGRRLRSHSSNSSLSKRKRDTNSSSDDNTLSDAPTNPSVKLEKTVDVCPIIPLIARSVAVKREDSSSDEDEEPSVDAAPAAEMESEGSDADDEGEGECELVKIRRANIKARSLLMSDLYSAKGDLDSTFTPRKKVLKRRRVVEPLPPREKSRRIAGLNAQIAGGLPSNFNEPATSYTRNSARPEDRGRNEAEEIQFLEVTDNNYVDFSLQQLKGGTKVDNELLTPRIKAFQDMVKCWSLTENFKYKVLYERIYSMDVHPGYLDTLVAVGGKNGQLGFLITRMDGSFKITYDYKLNSSPISCVTFSKYDNTKLYTTSYDGVARIADLVQQQFKILHLTPADQHDNHLCWVTETQNNVLLMACGDGKIKKIDTRTNDVVQEYKCHERSVRLIDVHPMNQNYFVTVSSHNKGFSIWDMRKMNKKNENGLLSFVPSKNVLNSAFFSPKTGSKLLTAGFDNTIKLFDLNNMSGQPKIMHSVAHNNQTGRWLTPFKARWHPQREDIFIIGSLEKQRRIEIYHADEHDMHVISTLSGPLFETIGCLNMFHPTQQAVISSNASGSLHVFLKTPEVNSQADCTN